MAMEEATLKAQPRTRTGKGSARAARREGKIPAVVYSHFAEPMAISVDPTTLRKAVKDSDHSFNTVLTLDLDGGGSKTALLKDWQVDPVSRQLLHADFIEIKLDEKLEAAVPLNLVGISEGVVEGGILNQVRRDIMVRCLPRDIPVSIDVDVTKMQINDSLHIDEIPAPENVELVFSRNVTLAVVNPPEGEAAAVGAEAGAEAAPAAGGETPEAETPAA